MSTSQQQITAFLAGKGMPAAGIAGVEGNLQVESGMDSTKVNPRENAHGFAQWEGPRWTALQQTAARAGTPATDPGTQLNFMWSELTSPGYSGVLQQLMTATDPAQAAAVFDQQYERSAGDSRQARVSAAQTIYSGGAVSGGAGQLATPAWNPFVPWDNLPGPVAGGVGDGMLAALRPLGKLIIDAGLIIMGLVMVIVAAVIIARAAGDNSSPPPAPTPDGDGEDQGEGESEHHRTGAAAGAESDAADAAVLA